jgi:carbonic anhydrase
VLDRLLTANEKFSQRGPGDHPGLPRRNLVILTCMDHRVQPLSALGLEPGDAMVVRNAGGRVTPAFVGDLEVLAQIAEMNDARLEDLQLLVIHHTDCGAGKVAGETDPHQTLRADLEALAADSRVPEGLSVTGMIYETATGRITLSG